MMTGCVPTARKPLIHRMKQRDSGDMTGIRHMSPDRVPEEFLMDNHF